MPYYCPFCGQDFRSLPNLASHMAFTLDDAHKTTETMAQARDRILIPEVLHPPAYGPLVPTDTGKLKLED